jgi:uncharacterized protein YyaL (SSP411 family)
LHAATGERWLDEAVRLAEEQERRLGDLDGGYFAAGADPRLLVRVKPAYDGAVASGNGVAAANAVELARRTGDPAHRPRAEGTLRAFASAMAEAPLAHVTLIRAVERLRTLPEAAAAAVKVAAPAAVTAGEALEEEAYAAVEIDARLGTSEEGVEAVPARAECAQGLVREREPRGRRPGAGHGCGRRRPRARPALSCGLRLNGGPGVPVYTGRVVIEGEIERRVAAPRGSR